MEGRCASGLEAVHVVCCVTKQIGAVRELAVGAFINQSQIHTSFGFSILHASVKEDHVWLQLELASSSGSRNDDIQRIRSGRSVEARHGG